MTVEVQCKVIRSPDDLKKIADEMIEYAKKHPLDRQGIMRTALISQQAGHVKVEERGPLTRIKAKKTIPGIDQYNRFIFLGTPLQICYYEYPVEPRIKQLTIVDLNQTPIEPEACLFVAEHFLDVDTRVAEGDTPPHVRVLHQ